MIIVRHTEQQPGREKFECSKTFSAHAVSVGGVVTLAIDHAGNFIYSAARDGTIMVHAIGQNSLPITDTPFDNPSEVRQLDLMTELEPVPHSELQTVGELMIIMFQKQNEQRKKTFRGEIMRELNGIKENLRELLDNNSRVTDIEKLERDEFVIDVNKQAMLVEKGEKMCSDIRKQAEITSLTFMLLRERCIRETWDTMEDKHHLKACKSIMSEKLIYNYAIRERSPQEKRLLKYLILQRRLELTNKLARMEQKL